MLDYGLHHAHVENHHKIVVLHPFVALPCVAHILRQSNYRKEMQNMYVFMFCVF